MYVRIYCPFFNRVCFIQQMYSIWTVPSGNANLIYTIIRKRNVFHQLVNLPTDHSAISKAMMKRGSRRLGVHTPEHTGGTQSMEGSTPAVEAEPGTLKVTLAATPGLYFFVTLGKG